MATETGSYTVADVLVGTQEDINADLNGECFIAGAEGEPEKIIENNYIIFPKDFPTASEATVGQKIPVKDNHMIAFLIANVRHSMSKGRSGEAAAKIAYLRFLVARNGLVSPSFSTVAHNVRYNHAIFTERTTADILDKKFSKDYVKVIRDTLTREVRESMTKKMTNLVCCVAYIFRVRGHHYMSDFRDRYDTLWVRCLYKPEELPMDWEMIATDSLHAIMPDVLDNFWGSAVNNARCAGTLIKRYDSAPAGSAGVVALERGLNDVTMLFPAIVEKVPDAHEEFKHVVRQVQGSRWGGSINARFYGATRQRVDEAKIGALASVVMGVYEHLAPQSKLRDSMALARLAQIAPATGGAIGVAAGRAARDERLNLIQYTVPSTGAVVSEE